MKGWDSEIVDIDALRIEHCTGCDRCKGRDCVINDDMRVIVDRFLDSDVVVFATPIRFSGPSSLVKTVIDRFQVIWNNRSLTEGKRRYMTFIASSGTDIPNMAPAKSIIRSLCLAVGAEWIDQHLFTGTDNSTQGLEEDASSFAAEIMDIVNSAPSALI